jgi:hypothetical protein
MYTGMRNSKHQMSSRSVSGEYKRESIVQRTHYDKSVLCADCDNVILGRLEDYAHEVLYKGSPGIVVLRGKTADGISHRTIQGLNYKKIKLFFLSILWRAHISKNVFFSKIDLGNDAETLRKILFENLDVDESDYKVAKAGLRFNENDLVKIVINPRLIETEGMRFCVFVINGFVYFFNLTKQNIMPAFENWFLKNSGEIGFPIFDQEESGPFLRTFFSAREAN